MAKKRQKGRDMHDIFKCIGLIGVPRHHEAIETHKALFNWLKATGHRVLVETALGHCLPCAKDHASAIDEIGQQADLAIVVGGDGNMLRAARLLCHYDVKVIGVNRGNLGFLTDIDPKDAIVRLKSVLSGSYVEDPRFLLEVIIRQDGNDTACGIAVNEIVVHPTQIAHMIDFDAYINDQSAFSQRADGLIIATPTGSTAYSLSAGGPIVAPDLDAFIITPMFPHSLSVRPLVVKSDHIIRLKFPLKEKHLEIACDSQISIPINSTNEVIIKRSPHRFQLIHGCEYDYFRNLSSKLGWSKKMF